MGVRLQGAFYSQKGVAYLVRIYDTSYSGATTDFTAETLNISYTPEGGQEERFVPVLPSELTLGMRINNATLETFVTDLVGAEEGRFYIAVGNLSDFAWNGYILVDLVSIQDTPLEVGYIFEIKAKDGLNRLKTIDYNDAGTAYTGKETFVAHILNCLNKIDFVPTLWPSSTLLNIVCNWHEDSYTYAANINPMKRSRINHRAFYYVDTRGNNVYSSCYDVLEKICRAWGAQIRLSGSAFWLTQLNEYADADSLYVFRYTRAGSETISSAQDLRIAHIPNNDDSPLKRYSGGRFEFYAPLSRVQVDYQHIATRNLLAGEVWDQVFDSAVTVEDIDSNSGTASLSFQGSLTYNSTWFSISDPFEEHFLVFAFTIKIGSRYYKRNLTVYSGGGWAYDAEAWVNTGADNWDWRTPGSITAAQDGITQGPVGISFLAEGVPIDGDLEITFDLVGAYNTNGDALSIVGGDPGVVVTYALENNYLELLATGVFSDQSDINRYSSENNAAASKKIELVTGIGDGPNLASPGHIEVQDDLSAWVLSDGWKVGGSGTAKAFSQLLCNEIIRGQLSPVKKMAQMPIQMVDPATGRLFPHKAIVYDSANWVFGSGRYNLATEIWDGVWWKVQTASGYTEQDVEFLPRDSGSGPPSSGGSSGTGGGGSGGGGGSTPSGNTVIVYQETFTADGVSAAFSVTSGPGTLPNTLDRVMVFRNGQHIAKNYISAVDGPGGELTLNFTPASGEEIVIVWFDIS